MSFFENTRKPVGLGGRIMASMMNLGHTPVAFQSAKKHPKECKSARVDIDRRITATIESWKEAAI